MKKYRRPKPSDIQVATMACWCYDNPTCWLCDQPAETHHIPCGPHRKAAEYDPKCCLRLCGQHHRGKHGAHDYLEWPIARQLALKLEKDPTFYDREHVNKARHRAPNAVSEDDVRRWLKPKEKADGPRT